MVMRSLCSLKCCLKIKLHPGIQISWLHHLNANSLTAWFGLVVSKQTWPHQDNNKGLADLQGPKFQLPSGQGEAKRPGTLHGQGSPPNTQGTARLRDLCSTTRCHHRSGPTSCHTSMTYSLSSLRGQTLPRSSLGRIPSGEQCWFELHSSLCCRRLICSN